MVGNQPQIRICKVIDGQTDTSGALRIKVRFPGIDTHLTDNELPWCIPLLPKLIHIIPKPGEAVLVMLENPNSPYDNRYYIGPVLSQPYFYNFDPYNTTALSGTINGNLDLLADPGTNPQSHGTLPLDEDVAIVGRKNSDVILKENEIRLRCGQKKYPDTLTPITDRLNYNDDDLAYIQMLYDKNQIDPKSDTIDKEFSSVINLFADRINFMSKDGIEQLIDYTDPDKLMSDDKLTDKNDGFLSKGHPMVYGDMLIKFLENLVQIFLTHTHPFPNTPPALPPNQVLLLNTDLNTMLSDYLRMS